MARPSLYSPELGASICARLIERDQSGKMLSLRAVCSADDMPCESTVFLWLSKHAEFSEMYARAREERSHMAADDIIEIADVEDDPNKARVRIDARKWYAGKLNAKHYGDKLNLDATVKVTHEQALDELE